MGFREETGQTSQGRLRAVLWISSLTPFIKEKLISHSACPGSGRWTISYYLTCTGFETSSRMSSSAFPTYDTWIWEMPQGKPPVVSAIDLLKEMQTNASVPSAEWSQVLKPPEGSLVLPLLSPGKAAACMGSWQPNKTFFQINYCPMLNLANTSQAFNSFMGGKPFP